MKTYVLLRQGVHQLGEDLVGDHGLSELVRVVGEAAKSKSSGLLDAGHVIEEKRAQQGHHT